MNSNYLVQGIQFFINIMREAVNLVNNYLVTTVNIQGSIFIIRWLDLIVVMLIFFLVFKFVFFRH